MSSGIEKVSISARELVEFSAASGDLFSEGLSGPTALEGIKGHRKIQKQRSQEWQSEFSLKQLYHCAELELQIRGRIDLVNENHAPPIIEEIKTTYFKPEQLPEAQTNLHWAQVKLYAWMYLEQEENHALDSLVVRSAWLNIPQDEYSCEEQILSRKALREFAQQLIQIYLDWYIPYAQNRKQVRESAKRLNFPFPAYREGQHDLAKSVYSAIKNQNKLLVEAPTGTGKSMSTLFPAVKAFGEGVVSQIAYLTTKGSAQANAVQALQKLDAVGSCCDYLILQAKERACACRSTDEDVRASCVSGDENAKATCSRTIGFFDRLPQARFDCLQARTLDVENIQSIANKHHLCAFELSLQMIRWSSIVVCDLNYVFDPLVQLPAFERSPRQRAVLVDEVHNFPDRAREMFSAALSTQFIRDLAKQLHKANRNLANSVRALAKEIEASKEQSTEKIDVAIKNTLALCNAESENLLGTAVNVNLPQDFPEFLKQLYRFQVIRELYGDNHTTLIEHNLDANNKSSTIKLACLDAAENLKRLYAKSRAFIGFSATLQPMAFYARLLGLDGDCFSHVLPPVFPVENQLTVRCDYIDTRWREREHSRQDLCELIHTVSNARAGKYLVYFPSYRYLGSIAELYSNLYPSQHIVRQVSSSNEAQRSAFLAEFFESDGPCLGFAILGGIFGEGIDFVGDALLGVVVVGAGIPQPDTLQKRMSDLYESQSLNGFQYAFQFPGLTRVMQTAGRVIRSETDRGVVVLVDPRFKQAAYSRYFPSNWQVQGSHNIANLGEKLSSFWSEVTF